MGHVILIEIFIPPYLFATVLEYPSKQLFFDAFGNLSFSYLFHSFLTMQLEPPKTVSCVCLGVLCCCRWSLLFSVALVCVCVCCVAPRVGVGGVRGSCVVGLRCVCVCVRAVGGLWGMSYLLQFTLSADMITPKG